MSERSTLKNLTDQINKEQYPYGICPFMSTVQFVPIQTDLAVKRAVPVPVPGFAPCLGGSCQLWNTTFKECSRKMEGSELKTIANAVTNIWSALIDLSASVCLYCDNH